MARGGRGSRGAHGRHSANTRSYVSGKIAGQYRAKGYSRSRSQHIGNTVVGKMGGSFRARKGSRKSYGRGFRNGFRDVRGTPPYHFRSCVMRDTANNMFDNSKGVSEPSPRYKNTYSDRRDYGKKYGKGYK